MARVKFYKINNSALSSLPISEGQLIFVQDTGKLYIDKDNSTRVQVEGLDLAAGTGISVNGTTITNAGVRAVVTGDNNGTIKVNTNGTNTNVAVKGLGSLAFKDNISTSEITSGTLSVARGGTGASAFTAGHAIIGSGTDALTSRAIDTTSGGTASSNNLITSGAVKAGLNGKLDTTLKGAANGLAELDNNGKVPSSQLPSYVDDVIEGYYYNGKFYKESSHTTEIPGESGKIYVDLSTEKTYRYSGSAFVVISETLALGETSSTAYRGDRGAAAYAHAVTNKGSAFASGLYKITTNAEGHVTGATAVVKNDITGLGIPSEDTNTTYTFETGASNGQIAVTPSGGTKQNVSVKGLAGAAYKAVDTSIAAASTSANLPTSKAVATFVEGKGYTTNTGTITKVQANGTDVASSGTANIPAASTSAYGVTKLSNATNSTSTSLAATPSAVKSAYDLANGKLAPSDVTITQTLTQGAEVGKIKVGNTTTTLYAPEAGAVATQLASANHTYYLTGVTSTVATSGDQIYNTRLSNTFTGVKYITSTSSKGGTLFVDDREATLGLYYDIA